MPVDLSSAPGGLPAVEPPAAERPGVPLPGAAPATDTLTALAIGVTVVVALYVGQDVLVPLALGVLLSFALAPLVSRLQRWRVGRVPAVLLAVALAMTVLAGVGVVVGNQVIELAQDLPRYESNIRAKIRDLKASAPGGGLVERTTDVIRDIGAEIADRDRIDDAPAPGPAGTARAPVPVRVEAAPAAPLAVLRDVAGPVLGPVATAGLVLVFVVFMLLQREDLRDRLIRLAGARDMRRATEALDEAGKRVSRYLLTHLVLNLLYGIPIGVGLWLIGVPNAALWGLLATVLRFIPFLGPVVAAAFPLILAVAVDPGWTLPLLTLALVAGLEMFSNNVLEPWLYGSSTGLSPFAVVLAAIFWTALWGPVGLLLATPLTVCVVVLGKHVPQLGFMEVLLGNQPALPAPARIYQRLLAHAPEEAARITEEIAAAEGAGEPDGARPAAWIHDALLLPALRLADLDRRQGTLPGPNQAAVLHGMEALLDHLEARREGGRGDPPDGSDPGSGRVLCVGARNPLDEAAALLLADLLHDRGVEADVLPCEAATARALPRVERAGVAAVALCYLDPGGGRHQARLVRRFRRHFGPDVRVLVGNWAGAEEDESPAHLQPAEGQDGADGAVGTLAEAVDRLVRAPAA